MDVEIEPTPEPDERDALVAGLERMLDLDRLRQPAAYRSAWRRIGILESAGIQPGRSGDSPYAGRAPRPGE